MVAFIIFSLALLILTIILYYRRVRQYYIDLSIYELRECKHDIIILMADNALKLNDADYKDLKSFLSFINENAMVFTKIGGLRFSTVRIVIENTLSSSDKLENKVPSIFLEHEEILKHYILSIKYSLKAIPFLHLRVITQIIKLILNLLIVLGIKKAKRHLSKFERFIRSENNHFNNHCLS